MGRKYQFLSPESPYFVTFTVIFWIDIFTRRVYRDIVLDSFKFCQQNKGLVIHAWVIMSNHIHMIISRNDKYLLQEIVRDFKKYTARNIIEEIENSEEESRKKWLLWMMAAAGRRNSRNETYQFWQQHNKPIELYSAPVIEQKLDYIHQNPVKAGIVLSAEEYYYSSAKNYYGLEHEALIEVECIL